MCGHDAPHHTMGHVRTSIYTFTFCQICLISGGNYTRVTCIRKITMVTHSECEMSHSWRTQFSSHGPVNLNRAVMPPPLPLHHAPICSTFLDVKMYPNRLSFDVNSCFLYGRTEASIKNACTDSGSQIAPNRE